MRTSMWGRLAGCGRLAIGHSARSASNSGDYQSPAGFHPAPQFTSLVGQGFHPAAGFLPGVYPRSAPMDPDHAGRKPGGGAEAPAPQGVA